MKKSLTPLLGVPLGLILLGTMMLIVAHHFAPKSATIPAPVTKPAPQPEVYTAHYLAALDVARVFGRSLGCADADPKLIDTVATEALRTGLDPRIFAATVAVESSCDSMAISRRGAVGLTQIVPRIWKGTYDFEHQYNLLNPDENLHVGAMILGALIKQYGVSNGLRRYNGLGVDCETCDTAYPAKIESLAGRKFASIAESKNLSGTLASEQQAKID